MSAINELKQMREGLCERAVRWRNSPPIRLMLDHLIAELDAIIRKYEEPTFAMEKEGAAVLWLMGPHTTFGEKARACFKAMIEAEEASHE